jgi:hypothetical protein
MQDRSDERAQRARLVGQQLHEHEELDGMFDVNQDRIVAVTSERLMIVSGGGHRGWAQMSIPWRVITAVQVGTEHADAARRVDVEYTRRLARMNRNGEDTVKVSMVDLHLEAPEDAQRMSRLMDARRVTAG